MGAAKTDDLFPEVRNPEGTQIINERCMIRTQDGHRVVLVSGIVLASYAVTDRMAEAYAMVSLVEQGWASQQQVASAFDCSPRTIRRDQRRFENGGLAALGHGGGYPKGQWRLSGERSRWIHRLKTEGHSNREIARRAGVSEMAIRKVLPRLGWKDAQQQPDLIPCPDRHACEPKPVRFLRCSPNQRPPAMTPIRRIVLLTGCWPDWDCWRMHSPLFGSAAAVPRAGVLLALPVLIASGVFECAQKIYGSLGPSFYGLRTSLLTLLLMALWRIKRPENLKEYSPQNLGRVLGLDRAPEVKTLRRKLATPGSHRTRRPVWRCSGPAARGVAWQGHGFPLRRWSRAGVSRPARIAQSACGAHAHFGAGHLGLLGQ